ncbi:hypothetical protein [Streptomyces sp. NBC_01803]|uniref:hypothetical protein n=1 Tax=Streptomyces sp. NBC_01803 TaxID=2975946 RepID=UPI002DD8BD4A|nr:hypothetical protein [Streptomyces sp. NBC_01803]WSA43676.1 hypothetical protein OIE51_05330 [Streptomyces sp. NBC_01803]
MTTNSGRGPGSGDLSDTARAADVLEVARRVLLDAGFLCEAAVVLARIGEAACRAGDRAAAIQALRLAEREFAALGRDDWRAHCLVWAGLAAGRDNPADMRALGAQAMCLSPDVVHAAARSLKAALITGRIPVA